MFEILKNKFEEIKNKDKVIKSTNIVYGNIIYQCYKKNGKKYREDGPAVIQHLVNGDSIELVNKTYYINDKLHRLDGPAYEDWYRHSNGKNLCMQQYYVNDKLHRLDGPAYISYNYDGTINCKLYYIEGIRYDDEFKFLIAAQIYKNSNNIEE